MHKYGVIESDTFYILKKPDYVSYKFSVEYFVCNSLVK